MNNKHWLTSMYLILIVAITGLVGSLYFSEVLRWAPCSLCWIQRIALYPLVPLVATGIIRRDLNLSYYILPLSIFGVLVAFYQSLLQYNVLPETNLTCSNGISCITNYPAGWGLITIPLLSLLAFAIITGLAWATKNNGAKHDK